MKSFIEVIHQMNQEVPSLQEMCQEIDVDGEELCRAMVGAAHNLTEVDSFQRVSDVHSIILWGTAIGYMYAAKKYRELLEGKS